MFALLCGQSCEKLCVNQVPASSVTQGLSGIRGNHEWGSRRSHKVECKPEAMSAGAPRQSKPRQWRTTNLSPSHVESCANGLQQICIQAWLEEQEQREGPVRL